MFKFGSRKINNNNKNNNDKVTNYVQSENQSYQVVIWSKSYCPYCQQTKKLFESIKGVQVKIHELDLEANGSAIQKALKQLTGQRTVPNVFVNNKHIGGNDDVQAAYRQGTLRQLLAASYHQGESQEEKKEQDDDQQSIRSLIEKENNSHQVVIWSKSYCPYCQASKNLLQTQLEGVDVAVHEIDQLPNGDDLQDNLYQMTGQSTVPNIFVNGKHLGGNSDLQRAFRNGQLTRAVSSSSA